MKTRSWKAKRRMKSKHIEINRKAGRSETIRKMYGCEKSVKMAGLTSGPWSCSRHQEGRLMFKVCSTVRRRSMVMAVPRIWVHTSRSSSASMARPQVKATWSAISSRSLVIRYSRLWHPSSFAKVKMACSSIARRAGTSSCRKRVRREEL